MKAWNLICQILLRCKVLEKPTKFISTNKVLIKITCTIKTFFVAETVIGVTYIPKGDR